MKLIYPENQITYQYAAQEFRRLAQATDPSLEEELGPQKQVSGATHEKEILMGSLQDLNRPAEDLLDDFIEDIIDVEVDGLTGVIAGSNPKFRRSLPSPV